MTSQEQRRLRKRDRFRQLLGLENRPPSPASPSTGIPSDASQALSAEQNPASLASPTPELSRTSSVEVCPDADKISAGVGRESPFYAGVKRVARDCTLIIERIQPFLAETPFAIPVNALLAVAAVVEVCIHPMR
ncbi:hypothetical protein BDV98DRAFT_301429, partial [Pterulicium gracile]